MNILCVEDDVRISRVISDALEEEQHHVTTVRNGRDAEVYISSNRFELAILDLMIPAPDGFEVLRRVRRQQVNTPVLVLSARGSMEDVVRALDLGADDYMVKPFQLEVLFARVRSLSRRRPVTEMPLLHAGNITLDRAGRQITHDGMPVLLTRREFSLLECLMRNAGKSVTRQQLIEAAWGLQADVSAGSLDFQLHGLRSKLGASQSIQTVRGVGYRIDV